MKIEEVLKSGGVQRFHAVVGMTKQNNSDHQWEVALLVQHFDPNCSKWLILAALTHDCAELTTGDMPANVKWDNPELKKILVEVGRGVEASMGLMFNLSLSEEEEVLLKICDSLSGMYYCMMRLRMGEVAAIGPFNAWDKFLSSFELNDKQMEFKHWLTQSVSRWP